MIKIMFVCHGNICRSPMAEFIFKDMLEKNNRLSDFLVASSATSTEEIYNGIGNAVYPPARAELARHGIGVDGKRAVQLKSSDADEYDMFVGMDNMNIRNMHQILGDGAKNKIFKLMDFTEHGGDVADPWYSGRFDVAYRDIYEGCTGLYEYLERK